MSEMELVRQRCGHTVKLEDRTKYPWYTDESYWCGELPANNTPDGRWAALVAGLERGICQDCREARIERITETLETGIIWPSSRGQ